MDRVLLSIEDVKVLFDWKDGHKELVRRLPAPLKTVEIAFRHNDIRIKGIREERWLKLCVYNGNQKIGKAEFEISADKMLHHRKGQINMTRDSFESVLACYCALMAFMVYEKPELVESESPVSGKAHSPRKHRSRSNWTTYILRRRKKVPQGVSGGHHSSPKGIFTVRGHYRRYKNGRTVWIAEYKKGTGDKKSKTYKMGVKKGGEVLSGR